jgi:hypothetical protein
MIVVALKLMAVLVTHLSLTVHAATVPTRTSTTDCLFLIRNGLVGGGSQVTCLRTIAGVPFPGSTVKSRGTMIFTLEHGTIRARVASVLRFGRDGVHAAQRVSGTVTGGSGIYRGYRGTVTARGLVVDRQTGLGRVSISYTFVLSR